MREYAEGDDPRSVDWSVTARMGRPFVKTYVDEREQTVLFLLDLSASMTGGFGAWSARQMCKKSTTAGDDAKRAPEGPPAQPPRAAQTRPPADGVRMTAEIAEKERLATRAEQAAPLRDGAKQQEALATEATQRAERALTDMKLSLIHISEPTRPY